MTFWNRLKNQKSKSDDPLVKVPIYIFGFKPGDEITFSNFVYVLNQHIENDDEEIRQLIEDKEELENENEILKAEIEGLNSDIEEFYKVKDPYYLRGVFPEDFH